MSTPPIAVNTCTGTSMPVNSANAICAFAPKNPACTAYQPTRLTAIARARIAPPMRPNTAREIMAVESPVAAPT